MPTTPKRASTQRALLTLADQTCSSGSNFVLIVLIARHTSTAAFGQFAIAFGVITWAWALSRSSIGIPLGLDLHKLSGAAWTNLVRRSIGASMVAGLVVSVILVALGALLPSFNALSRTLILLGVLAPVLLCQDIGRFISVARKRPGHALLSDAIWLVIGATGLVLDVTGVVRLTPLSATAVWLAGGVVALLVLGPVMAKPTVTALWSWFVTDNRRNNLLFDATLGAGVPLLITGMIALLASPATVGTLRGATSLMSPINVLIAAVSLGLVSEAARLDERAARRLMAAVSGTLVLTVVCWGILLALMPENVGAALMGQTWNSARAILPFVVLEYVGLSGWNGAAAFLRSRHRTGTALQLRVLYSATGLCAAGVATVIWGRPQEVALALAIAALAIACLGWARARASVPEESAMSQPSGQ